MRETSVERSAGNSPTTEEQKARWKAATRWRRGVEAALSGSGLTFTQWLVLDALDELIAETDDAVMQFEVAARVGLDQGTISLVMRALADKALVDRAPDMTGKAWRVLLTHRSRAALCELAMSIEAASVRNAAHDCAAFGERVLRGRIEL